MEGETGYVSGTGVEMWTTVPEGDSLNVLHLHLNDTAGEVAIDVKYLQDDKINLEEYDIASETFEKDKLGNSLRYKVLIQREKVFAVLYNTGTLVESIPFTENVISQAQLLKFTTLLGKITQIPTGIMASKHDIDFTETKH